MDADEHAPPPYDGTMSDPLASPSQSQTLNAARLARLRTAGRRTAAEAEPAAPTAPPIADVAALDAFYKANGYVDVRVDSRILLSPDNREAKVVSTLGDAFAELDVEKVSGS